jgi:hypothetical protein
MELDPSGTVTVYLNPEAGRGVNYEEAYTVEMEPIGEVLQVESDSAELLDNGWVKLPQETPDPDSQPADGYYPPTSVIRVDTGRPPE